MEAQETWPRICADFRRSQEKQEVKERKVERRKWVEERPESPHAKTCVWGTRASKIEIGKSKTETRSTGLKTGHYKTALPKIEIGKAKIVTEGPG